MDQKEQEKDSRKRRICRALLLSGTLLVFASLCWLVWDNLRQNIWAYYTDDAGTEVGVDAATADRLGPAAGEVVAVFPVEIAFLGAWK